MKKIFLAFCLAILPQVSLVAFCPKDSKVCKGKKAYVTGSIILRKGPIVLATGTIQGGISGFLHFGDEVLVEEITESRYQAMARYTYGLKVRAANGTTGYVHEFNHFEPSESSFSNLHTGQKFQSSDQLECLTETGMKNDNKIPAQTELTIQGAIKSSKGWLLKVTYDGKQTFVLAANRSIILSPK